MNRSLISAAALAALALAAACGGGGDHAASISPGGSQPNSGARATGTVVLSIPSATTASSTARTPAFVSSAVRSASVSLNGGSATNYDVSPTSPLCSVVVPTGARNCTINITAASGSLAVLITLYSGSAGTGSVLGSASSTTTVAAPAAFSMVIDINPAIASLTSATATFASGLNTISWKVAASALMTLVFTDAGGATITPGNTSPFQNAVVLSSNDPNVSFSPSPTITNAAQAVTMVYNGSSSTGSTYNIVATVSGSPIGTLPMKTAGYYAEFNVPTSTSQPIGITVGQDGLIWFTENLANKIGRVNFPAPYTLPSPTINEFPMPTASSRPAFITPGISPTLWISEAANFFVAQIDTSSPSPVAVETNAPNTNQQGITQLGGFMWLVDQNGNNLQQMNATSRNYVGTAPLGGGCTPEGVAAGSDGFLWVTCTASNAIYRVNPANIAAQTFVTTNAPSPLIAKGPDNAMWFTEPTVNKIGRIAVPSLAYTEYATPGGSVPTGIAAGPDNAMWFGEAGTSRIGRIDVTTKSVTDFAITASALPAQIVQGPDGWIWFTESNGNRIGRMQTP